MCRPLNGPGDFTKNECNTQQCNDHDARVTTILWVTVTFIGGYGMGVNDTDVRLACFTGATVLLLFRWLSQPRSSSTLSRVTSVDAIKHLSTNLLSTLDCSKSLRSAIQSITRKECFARLDYIERLSISDMAILFRYAVDANLDEFDEKRFLADNTQTVRSVITAIKMAVKVSRGSLSEGTTILSTTGRTEGDIDALRFVAVTRIYAEWRNVRMVPKGYQRYAIGLSLGYRDVLQNLEKIERGVHEYLKHHQNMNIQSNGDLDAAIPSPTLKQLLQFEAATNVHKKLPRLTERSAASGLLWTKRQLHYQTVLLTNTLEVPVYYASGEEAARAAYHTVYVDYHGWAVKQIFTRSFGGSPPLDKLWLHLSPPTDSPKNHSKYKRKQDNFPPKARTLSDMNSATTMSMSMSERTEARDDDSVNEAIVALDNFRVGIVEKWEDVLRMVNCGKQEKRKQKENLILSSESHFNLNQFNRDMAESSLQENSGADVSDMVSFSSKGPSTAAETVASKQQNKHQLIQKSKGEAEDFIRGVSPMIADLGVMIDQLNMNDPTKA